MMIMIYTKNYINNENDILIIIKSNIISNIINNNNNIIKNIINAIFTMFI